MDNINGKITRFGNVVINMHPTARIDIDGELILNRNLPNKSAKECMIIMSKNSVLKVSGRFSICYDSVVYLLHGAHLNLHSGFINANSQITVHKELSIGDDLLTGRRITLFDSDFHKISVDGIPNTVQSSVRIGNHVWIGANSAILKGVTIGDGAIIGANSVVTRDIFPNCLAVGNPAATIKSNVKWSH